MKTNFSFGKSLIICVLSFFAISAVFTGCGTNYDDDIDGINEQIEALKSSLAALQTSVTDVQNKLNSGKLVQSVSPYSSGGRNGTQITFSDGSSTIIYDGVDGTGGTPGADGRIFVIKDSLWHYLGGTSGTDTILYTSTQYPTGIRAIPIDGKDGVQAGRPDIKDGFWVFPVWNATTQVFDTITSNLPSGDVLSYIVDEGAPKPYKLYIRVMDAAGVLSTSRQEILLPRVGTVNAAFDFLGYVTGYIDPQTKFSLNSIIPNGDLVMFYWRLASNVTWEDAQKEVERYQVLTSLRGNNIHLVVNTSIDFTNAGKLSLVDSKGNELPILLEAPIKVEGLLTKASTDPIYLIPLSATDETYTTNAILTSSYLKLFEEDAVYYITNADGSIKSTYSSFTIKPEDGSTLPAATPLVSQIGDNPITVSGADRLADIKRNQEYKLYFSDSELVYDYKVEKVGTAGGLDYDETTGILSVSTASVTIKVIKLLTDGTIDDTEEIIISATN